MTGCPRRSRASRRTSTGIHRTRSRRRGPLRASPTSATASRNSDRVTKVLRVPMVGTSSRSGRNAPRKLPAVETA